MKNLVFTLALLFALGGSLFAQSVKVQVLMSQDQFVADEAVPVRVRIINHSGETILFGSEDWVSFSVEARDKSIVLKSGEPPEPHDFDVKSAEAATTPRTDLAPYFSLVRPGRYSVTATVHLQAWDKAVVSTPVYFDVVRGARIWEQEFGVPQTATNNGQPETRKYILQQATLKRHQSLFFRLTDGGETKTLRLTPLGPLISFASPQMNLDQANNLHLLYQEGARTYNYLIFNPDGDITSRQTYAYAGSAPHLRVDDAGKVVITGNVRRLAENNFSSTHAQLTNVIPPPIHKTD